MAQTLLIFVCQIWCVGANQKPKSCDKGKYLLRDKCEPCPPPEIPESLKKQANNIKECVACNKFGECMEPKCEDGWFPSWYGNWAAGSVWCQEKDYCPEGGCGPESTCLSTHDGGYVCHCPPGLESFPRPNKKCKTTTTTTPPNMCNIAQPDCGGSSKCKSYAGSNYYKCECAAGSTV